MELEAHDPAPGLLVWVFFQAYVVLDDSDNIVPARYNGPTGEGEQGIEVVAAKYDSTLEIIVAVYGLEVGGYGAYELIVDEDRHGKCFGSVNVSNIKDVGQVKTHCQTHHRQ